VASREVQTPNPQVARVDNRISIALGSGSDSGCSVRLDMTVRGEDVVCKAIRLGKDVIVGLKMS